MTFGSTAPDEVDGAGAGGDDVDAGRRARGERHPGIRRDGGDRADAGDDLEGDAGLDAGPRLLGEAVEDGRVAVHEADDEARGVGLRGAHDELGPRGLGEALAVVAVAGVDDVDLRAAPALDDGLAGHLVDDDGVGRGEQLAGTHREQARVAGAGPDEDDPCGDAGGGRGGRARGAHSARSVAMWSAVDGGSVVSDMRSAAPSSRRRQGEAAAQPGSVGDVADGGAAQVGGAVGGRDDGPQRQLGPVHPLDDLGERADRGGAPGLELGEEHALGGGAGAGVGVVERGDGRRGRGVVGRAPRRRAPPGRVRAASGGGRAARWPRRSGRGGAARRRRGRRHPGGPRTPARSRVSTLPRRSVTSRPRPSAASWARRRGDPVPTVAPGRQLAEGEPVAGDERVAGVLAGRARPPRSSPRRASSGGP